jgi:hypothetical protein
MNDIQLKRTKVLIVELHKLRDNTEKPKFNMGDWMNNLLSRMSSKAALHKAIMEATKNPCGTAACLAGKAGLIPRIRRMGFKWDVLPERSYLTGQAQAGFHYDGWTGDHAVQEFFGSDVFHEVFMDISGIRTLLQGIRALEKIVKEEEAIRNDVDYYGE